MATMNKAECYHVKVGEAVTFPEYCKISHSSLIEPKKGKPYFAILVTREHEEKQSAIGFDLSIEDDE